MLSRLSVVLLLVALPVLAGLQYQWIGQVSQAERQRLEEGVRDSSSRFADDFAEEIRSVLTTFELRDGLPPDVAPVVARYEQWNQSALYPHLLRTLYLMRSNTAGEVELLRLDPETQTFHALDWPDRLLELKEGIARDIQSGWPDRRRDDPAPVGRADSAQPLRRATRLEGMLAILIPIDRPREPRNPRNGYEFGPQRPQREGWILAELDEEILQKEILPELVARRFPVVGDQNYRVAVVSMTSEPHTVFTSGGAPWTSLDLATPDHTVDLLDQGRGGPRGRNVRNGLPPDLSGPPPSRVPGRRQGGPSFPVSFVGQNWRLMVKHHAGSLEQAVEQLRRRDLAISFGILVVLGIGTVTAVLSGQRAKTLGRLQMEFAAGVSHELRTPLAVIQSAAHNLRAGVVRDKEGIEEYATIVQGEARRLSDMVEHVMTYAETQSGRKRYDIAPIDVMDVLDRAARHMESVIGDSNVTIEPAIDSAVPPVMADAGALTQCLQNLLSNAVKYGKHDDAVQIEVEAVFDREARKVRLSVTDHGPGVPEADVRHLFEPFHRGSNATTSTAGNGLGLHLVRKIMEAQNGTVTYEPGKDGGARFTLIIPAADSYFL
jgi:signal transduction histidine kinase